jgi:general secretion pathway protein F
MALFAWKGLDASGKTVSGTREADGAKALRGLLRRDAVFLTELREVVAGERAAAAFAGGTSAGTGLKREIDLSRFFERVSPPEVAIFTRQLATLLKAGIPLAEGLGALAEQADNHKLQMILAGVRQQVNEGGALAEALAKHPRIFPELYTNMVRSGEAAGNLDAVLERLAVFLDQQIGLRSKVASAMTYPAVMAFVGLAIMSVLLVAVVPQIATIFSDQGKALPWNTQMLILASDIASGYWWLILLLLVVAVIVIRRWWQSPKGRHVVDRVGLRMWVLGPLIRYVAVARFARTLSTMLASGVQLLTALEIVKKVLNNTVLERVVEQARDSIREGESIAATLKRSGQFPSLMCHMVAVGERSGQLEAMLENVATAYERDVETKVGRLTSLLAPLLIVMMGVGVGFMVFSILGPIMDMQQLAQ